MANSPEIIEAQLVEAIKKGDKQAFSTLYDRYSSSLFGIAKKIMQDDATAEDATQEAFVKIWKNIHGYDRSKGKLFTWMLNIVRNTCIDKLRKQKRRVTIQNPIEDVSDLKHEETYEEQPEEEEELKMNLENLKPEWKLLLDEVYFLGFTQKEVSIKYNIPLGTVKTRIRAAVQHLRKKMDHNGR